MPYSDEARKFVITGTTMAASKMLVLAAAEKWLQFMEQEATVCPGLQTGITLLREAIREESK